MSDDKAAQTRKSFVDSVKGKAKEVAGAVTGNDSLTAEGQLDQAQALSHAVGPRTSTSNGVVEAMLLPHTMRYNEPVTGTRMAAIGDVFGAASAAAAVREFIAELGVPTQLREVGLAREVLAEVVDHAMDDWAITQVPRPADRDELLELLDAAW
ncbi:iron-containing alcohol dehydrogenase [Mycobacterium sp. NAZ190054]|uniref:iron-containing alcohol dehydrogenase n=1 Tax=Mycobacterium sp. NAZ190054 TaxID=1747766 RepID=UPI000795093E|nr:iron-containing alcohol dehydrogenase [Mycobacterium sp. NAZ190054]KWX67724.1 hypothetical protein ASJ79_20570 [Mycobacterium sp. NAZ190054]